MIGHFMHGLISDLLTVDAHAVPKSPVIPMPVESTTLALVQRYLNVFMRYAGVGIIGTMVHFLILLLLVDFTTPVLASTVGAIAGCITNFRLARSYVFTARANQLLVFPKFATVAIAGIGLNAAIMLMFTPFLPVIVCQLAATGIVFMTGFLLNNCWSVCEYRA